MKPSFLAPILSACVFAASLAAAQSHTSMAQQILSLLHQQEVAAGAHDTDAFLATYFHDASLVFVSDGEIIHGFDALRDQQLKWWKNGKSDVVYSELGQPEIVRLDDHTALVTQQLASHRTMPDGNARDNRFVVTSIFRKFPIGWRVTYCHESHTP